MRAVGYVRKRGCVLRGVKCNQRDFMEKSSRRCENKQGFVFISENVSALRGFTVSLRALRLCKLFILQRQNNMKRPSCTQTRFSKEEAARMTTVNCCGTALCCSLSPHPTEWGMTQQAVQLYTLYIELGLKFKAPHLLLCVSSHSVSHYNKEWWAKNPQLPLSLVSIWGSRGLGSVHIIVTCRINEHEHPVLE